MAQDERYLLVKVRFRRVVVGMVAAFLGWYLAYVALSAFARGFMARQVFGNVNVALLLGVLQFASTFLLAWCYSRYARRALDPLTAELRDEVVQGVRRVRKAEGAGAGRHRRDQATGDTGRHRRAQEPLAARQPQQADDAGTQGGGEFGWPESGGGQPVAEATRPPAVDDGGLPADGGRLRSEVLRARMARERAARERAARERAARERAEGARGESRRGRRDSGRENNGGGWARPGLGGL